MKIITIKQMAKEFGRNVNYIYDLLILGYIKYIRVGKNFKVREEWWLEFRETERILPSYADASKKAKTIRENLRVT